MERERRSEITLFNDLLFLHRYLDETAETPLPEKAVEIPVMIGDVESIPEQTARDSKDHVAPRFIKPLKNCQVFENEYVKLEVVVEGFPKPSVHWEFEGKPLVESICVFTENKGNVFRYVCVSKTFFI